MQVAYRKWGQNKIIDVEWEKGRGGEGGVGESTSGSPLVGCRVLLPKESFYNYVAFTGKKQTLRNNS